MIEIKHHITEDNMETTKQTITFLRGQQNA